MESRDLIRIQRNDWKWNHFYYFPPSFSSLSFSYFPLILLSARLAFFSLSYLLTILSCFFTFLSATPLLFSLLFILFLSSSSLNYIFVNSLSFSAPLLCLFFLFPLSQTPFRHHLLWWYIWDHPLHHGALFHSTLRTIFPSTVTCTLVHAPCLPWCAATTPNAHEHNLVLVLLHLFAT